LAQQPAAHALDLLDQVVNPELRVTAHQHVDMFGLNLDGNDGAARAPAA
jgi:hypothetical protein